MEKNRIYLDYASMWPLTLEASHAMQQVIMQSSHPDSEDYCGNPSSVHRAGRSAKRVLDEGRETLAQRIGCNSADIVWTSGGTEACNLGIQAVSDARCDGSDSEPSVLIQSSIEHPAVSEAISRWAASQAGRKVMVIIGSGRGLPPDQHQLEQALRESAAENRAAAIQWVNHETGTVLDIPTLASLCAVHQVPLFVDATQALGKIEINLARLEGVSAMAFSASKVGGPTGVGALWLRRDVKVKPLLVGGSQERGRRAGTPSIINVAGFSAALQSLNQPNGHRVVPKKKFADFERQLCDLGGVINAVESKREGTICNISFEGIDGNEAVAALDLEGIACSNGPACSSGLVERSKVVEALYQDEPWRAKSAIRLSVGPMTTFEHLELACETIKKALPRLRKMRYCVS